MKCISQNQCKNMREKRYKMKLMILSEIFGFMEKLFINEWLIFFSDFLFMFRSLYTKNALMEIYFFKSIAKDS